MYTYPEEEGRSRYARDEQFTHTVTHTHCAVHMLGLQFMLSV